MDGSITSLISESDVAKLREITRLHDEAFWHYHKYDGHAKISDGAVHVDVRLGTVWDRETGPVEPEITVSIYSYVVATSGDRNHEFESVDEALAAMVEWHAEAMAYNPTEDELAEMDVFAAEMWDAIKDKVVVIDASKKDEEDNV